jgi:hypothetical protein
MVATAEVRTTVTTATVLVTMVARAVVATAAVMATESGMALVATAAAANSCTEGNSIGKFGGSGGEEDGCRNS